MDSKREAGKLTLFIVHFYEPDMGQLCKRLLLRNCLRQRAGIRAGFLELHNLIAVEKLIEKVD